MENLVDLSHPVLLYCSKYMRLANFGNMELQIAKFPSTAQYNVQKLVGVCMKLCGFAVK